jgi:hypothetical protein
VVFQTNAVISSIGLGEGNAKWAATPNPTDGMLWVEGEGQPETFVLTDLAGRIVYQGTWPERGSLDVASLSAGSYVLELNGHGRRERHLIVKR